MLSSLWSRVRRARLVQITAVYLGASWLILEVTDVFVDKLGLPEWSFPAALLLLLIGLVIIVGTAWVQAHPPATAADRPDRWELDWVDLRESVTRGRFPHLTWGRALIGGLVAFSLLFGVSGAYVLLTQRGASVPTELAETGAGPGIAVLPFRVVGPALELWREGMVDLLSTNLDDAAGLRAIDPRTVLSRWRSELGDEGSPGNAAEALRVARSLNARYALMGSAVALGGEVRLTAEVYDVASDELKGRTQIEGSPDSVLALVDRLSMQILRAGLARDTSRLPKLAIARVTTASVPALKAYLQGEQKFRRSHYREAIEDYTRAVEADSAFALALYRLALSYGWMEAFSPRVLEYSRRSARHANRLPRREVLLLRGNALQDHGRLAAVDTLEELTRRYPDDAEGWYMLGEAYFHLGPQGLHPPEKYRQAFQESIELDPRFAPAYSHLVDDAFFRGDSAAAADLIERLRQLDPTSSETVGLGLAYDLVWGDSVAHARARAGVGDAPTDTLHNAHRPLWWTYHDLEPMATVSGELSERGHEWGRLGLFHSLLLSGRVRDARAAIAGGGPPGPEEARTTLSLYLTGYVDAAATTRAANVLAADPIPVDRFLLGARAAAAGRWGEADAEAARLMDEASPDTADGIEAADRLAFARVLQSYTALHRGDRAAAVAALRELLPELPGVGPGFVRSWVHAFLRYEVGKALLDLGRAGEAERYFRSLDRELGAVGAPLEFYLGATYEALGAPEKARLHYSRFVRLWEDCDPELRPWRERGQRALERLAAERSA